MTKDRGQAIRHLALSLEGPASQGLVIPDTHACWHRLGGWTTFLVVAILLAGGCGPSASTSRLGERKHDQGVPEAGAASLRAIVLDGGGVELLSLSDVDFVDGEGGSLNDGTPALLVRLRPAAAEQLRSVTASAERPSLRFIWQGRTLGFAPNVVGPLSSVLLLADTGSSRPQEFVDWGIARFGGKGSSASARPAESLTRPSP